MEEDLPGLRPLFNTILDPKASKIYEENSNNAALNAFNNNLAMQKLVPFLDSAETVIALAYVQSSCYNPILTSIDKETFCFRICYTFPLFEPMYNKSVWQQRIYIHNGVKLYNNLDIPLPTEVLSKVPSLMVDSHYCRLNMDLIPYNYVPSKTMLPIHWMYICACIKLKKINFVFVTIDEDAMNSWVPQMKFPLLKEFRLESVHAKEVIMERMQVDIPFLRDFYVPPKLVRGLASQETVETIELVSLFITEDAIIALEENLECGMKNLKKVHLEDLIVDYENIQRLDRVVLNMIQSNTFKTLTLALHANHFGKSLFETILARRIKIENIELIINMKDTNLELFKKITHLQDQCDTMKLTFHRSWKAENILQIIAEMKREMAKWKKVNDVMLGKTLFPYLFPSAPLWSTPTYLDFIASLSCLPNLEKFGIRDRVSKTVMVAVTEFVRNSSYKEITLGLSDRLEAGEFGMDIYNELLSAIPVGVESLGLLFFPLDNNSAIQLERHKHTLKYFKYYQLVDQKKTRQEIDQILPKTKKTMKMWLTSNPNMYRMHTVSNYLINAHNA